MSSNISNKLFFVLFFIIFVGGCQSVDVEGVETTQLRIGDVVVETEVVRDLESQIKGLSGRENLGEDDPLIGSGFSKGMLFVYDEPKIRSFWMEGMRFSLDIIFINSECHTNDANYEMQITRICEYKIVDIVESLPVPEVGEESARYTSKEAADMVLEVKAGFIRAHGIEVGDGVDVRW